MASRLLTVAEARERVLSALNPLAVEQVAIEAALDRVLALDLTAAGDVPPFTSAAMDGYAVTAGPAGRTLRIVGEARAGAPSAVRLGAEEAIRTSTGAALPDGADAIIRQEQAEAIGDQVTLRAAVASANDVRRQGEDLAAGAVVLGQGTRLGSAELAAAVAAGARELTCFQRPRVAIVCTGSELRAPGEPLGPGEIHNSNAISLHALAARAGALVSVPARRVIDDREETKSVLAAALETADLVVVSGGLSVGPHDHVKPALEALGVRCTFWGVGVQPGKPTWFGAREGQAVFGLPGTPVAAYVAFILFAVPALLALQGASSGEVRQQAKLTGPFPLNPAREQAVTVCLRYEGCRTIAVPNGPQGSNLISSLLGADALAMLPSGTGELAAGSPVDLVPLPG